MSAGDSQGLLQAGQVPGGAAAVSGTLSAAAISWTLQPLARPDPLALTDDGLIAQVLAEADSYRELLRTALALLHGRHRETVQLRAQHGRLRDEYRALRAQMMETAS